MRIKLSKGTIIDPTGDDIRKNGLRVWCAGESGSGKSTAVMLIATQLIEQGGQVIALDVHGELDRLWDVNPAKVVRIGYGSDAVTLESVEWCLNIVRSGKSVLIDLSHWMLEPKVLDQFALEFLRGLFELRHKKPAQCFVVVEEAASFCPQAQMTGQAENILVFLKIVTEGRKFGINFILCSQQQSLVDVRAVKGCNMHILLRVSSQSDWKVISKYIPPKLHVEFGTDDKRYDIRHFHDGEAVIVSRWTGTVRTRLLMPTVGPRDFLKEGAVA